MIEHRDYYPPLLEQMYVAAPCNVSWDSMTGDDRVRFCQGCSKNVYNISDLSQREAESFLRDNMHKICVRFYRREDGTIITDNCPVGLRKLRAGWKRLSRVAACICSLLLSASGAFARHGGSEQKKAPEKGHGKRTPTYVERAPMGLPPPPLPGMFSDSTVQGNHGYQYNRMAQLEESTQTGPGNWRLAAHKDEKAVDLPAIVQFSLAKDSESAGDLTGAERHYREAVQEFRQNAYSVQLRRQIMANYANLLRKMQRFQEANEIDIGLYKEEELTKQMGQSEPED